ncbi:UNVERIFIED_CONTAM: hypothetical protein GTU68_011875 [Idotea baltica]|nr:hypothetical protein [Idotea baltica]
MARLDDIRKRLGHENDVIDYLKIDIEGHELNVFDEVWETSEAILRERVAQIGMEIHLEGFSSIANLPRRLRRYWTLMKRLECLGFQVLHSEPNSIMVNNMTLHGKPFPCCFEVVWINTKISGLE